MSGEKKTKKWNYKQWAILTRTMCLIGGGILLGRLFMGGKVFAIVGSALLFPGILIAAFTLNCPKCGKLVADILTHNEAECAHCGEKLELEPLFGRKKKK